MIDGFAGLRNDIDTERFELGDLAKAQNVLIDNSNRLERRPGATLQVAGAIHSLWSDDQNCVAMYISGGVLYRLTDDMQSESVMVMGSDDPVSYTICDDRVFFTNGTISGVYQDGLARSSGLLVPASPTIANAPGSLDVGDYQVTVTHMDEAGQESGALPGSVLTVTNGGIQVTLPAAIESRAVARVVYITTANGEQFYEAAVVGVNAQTFTVTGFDSNIPIETLNLCPTPPGQLIAEYMGHLLVADGEILYYSQTYGLELWDLRDYIPFSSQITMIGATEQGVYIGTEKSIHFLAGQSPEEYQITRIADYGVPIGAGVKIQSHLLGFEGESLALLFLSKRGWCIGLPGGVFDNLTDLRYRHELPGRIATGLQTIGGSTYVHANL